MIFWRRFRWRFGALLALFLMSPAGGISLWTDDWQVVSHEPDLTIYARMKDGQELKDFRGVLRLRAPLRQVVTMLLDANAMPQWFYRMKEARILDSNGSDESHIYMVIKGKLTVSDRDAVVDVKINQDSKTQVITINAVAKPDYYPTMPDRVRIPRMEFRWTVTPLSPKETEVRLDGQLDMGGHISPWAANLVVEQLPRQTLRHLRQRIKAQREIPALDEHYKNAILKFPETSP